MTRTAPWALNADVSARSGQMVAKLAVWLRLHAVLASLIVLSCSVSVRSVVALRSDPAELVRLYPDATTYLVPARSLVEQQAFLDRDGRPMLSRTPGYPGFLAALMVLLGDELRTLLLAQTIVLSCGPLLLYWLARRIVPPVTAIIAALIAALSPWGVVLSVIPISDGLFLTIITAMFLFMKLTLDAGDATALINAVGVGCLAGAAVLVRPIWPLLVLVPLSLAVYLTRNRRGVWWLVAVSSVCALGPAVLWTQRNQQQAHFVGLSDVASVTAWQYLAARVRADVSGQDRHMVSELASHEETTWGVPSGPRELDTERWKRANAVFRAHPVRTAYAFGLSALEHTVHPSPDVLRPARLNFSGDFVVLALLWGGLLSASGYALWRLRAALGAIDNQIDHRMLLLMLIICALLTLSSGVSFAAGSRLRAPLEAIVPLLAAIGLVSLVRRRWQVW